MAVKKKIVLLGDSAVGKTSLIRRYVLDIFEDSYIATIGSKVTRKTLSIRPPDTEIDLTLIISDLIGREGYAAIHARTFAGVHGAILVSDLTRKETLASLERYWIPTLFKVVDNVPLVFVANKSDLTGAYAFEPGQIGALAGRYNVGLGPALPPHLSTSYSTSAKTGNNVGKVFEALGHLLVAVKPPEDPVRELYQMLIAMGIARSRDTKTSIGALDAIIVDFCQGFDDDRLAMSLLRQEILRAGVDVRAPTKEGLLRAVEYLAEAESEFKDEKTVLADKQKRLQWVLDVKEQPRSPTH